MSASRSSSPLSVWRCSPGRRLPAYARELANARARGLVPANRQVRVYLDHWPTRRRCASTLGPAICCPIDARPHLLDWRYLAALDVLAVVRPGADEGRVRALLRELIAARPKRLILLRPGGTPAAEFIVSAARGVEVWP
ncbi:hypothetical protein [Aromatoleum anaerobium]|uniref:Uncharacterized protein n=1 Tax=Aromatoleum anaerobium TaxID=182180 RepID=A0ABX1PUB4_9RHOO|nr:hypothetical protein [Aromatoleum anaerobium]MCK0507365.1 hypothetical protein [Aromatoleum anaerobium]